MKRIIVDINCTPCYNALYLSAMLLKMRVVPAPNLSIHVSGNLVQ